MVVFKSLQKLFPQVDNRILKAASIEHAGDLDAAVEFILLEVSPYIPEPTKSSENGEHNFNLCEASPAGLNKRTEEASTSSVSSILSSLHFKSTSPCENGECVLCSNESDLDESQNLYNSIVNATPPKRDDSNNHVYFANEGLSGSTSSEGRNWDLSVLIANNRASSQDRDSSNYSHQNGEHGGDKVGLLKEDEADGSNGNELNNHSAYESEAITRSTHSVNADILEDTVSDAKTSKISLLASVDMLTTMLNNVVHLEEKAKNTKEEASSAGQKTLGKVEDLRQMLLRAKEANNMHAGEVYGERSILSTEARELQSRLLSLSDQKNKSLETIEEIHQILEARLAAAEEEIAKAEKERSEREESAQRALKEQEEMMNAIVEQSNKLQQEAEENTMLREFLVDHGCMVDSLQGEIAVICEDVARLKEIVEGRLPMTKSILSIISSVSSSTSSASPLPPQISYVPSTSSPVLLPSRTCSEPPPLPPPPPPPPPSPPPLSASSTPPPLQPPIRACSGPPAPPPRGGASSQHLITCNKPPPPPPPRGHGGAQPLVSQTPMECNLNNRRRRRLHHYLLEEAVELHSLR